MHVSNQREAKRRSTSDPVSFVAFDLLYIDGHSLMDAPYDERRERLGGTPSLGRDVHHHGILPWRLGPGHLDRDRRERPGRRGRQAPRRRRIEKADGARIGRRSSRSAPRKWSSGPGPKGRANGNTASAPSCWASPTRAGCATSARWAPASAPGACSALLEDLKPLAIKRALSSQPSPRPMQARPISSVPTGGRGGVRRMDDGRPAASPDLAGPAAGQDSRRGRRGMNLPQGRAVRWRSTRTTIEGRELSVTNLDKVLFPAPASPRAS